MGVAVSPEVLVYQTITGLDAFDENSVYPIYEPIINGQRAGTFPSVVYRSVGRGEIINWSEYKRAASQNIEINVRVLHESKVGELSGYVLLIDLTQKIIEALAETGRLKAWVGLQDGAEDNFEFIERSTVVDLTII